MPSIFPAFSVAKLVLKTVLAIMFFAGVFALGYYTASKTTAAAPGATILGEPVVMRTKGGALEVTKVVSTESITQTFPGLFFNNIVTITVPATYRYHVELAPEWKFMRQDNMFVVVAPPLRPSMPVAIDTAGMVVTAGWPFSSGEKLQAVAQITPLLNQKFQTYMARQREDARKTITEFVTKWVLEQDKWNNAKDLRVVVLFPDEPVKEALKVGLYPVPMHGDSSSSK